MIRSVRAAAALLLLALLAGAGARPLGPLPALGPFLEPAHGVWSMARSASLPAAASATVPGLSAPVEIVYDVRAVPHVFASNELDAYRALGFVVARDRLFQLVVQTMAGSGRLTEIGGRRLLAADREMRGLGLPRSAERHLAALPDSSLASRIAAAYADGVNAWIDQMPASAIPLELRLLGARRPRWSAVNSYHLLSRMGWLLASSALERDRAVAASLVGAPAAAALFPDDSPIQEPIQPNGANAPWLDRSPLPPPGAPDSAATLITAALDGMWPSRTLAAAGADGDVRSMASNNWAVAPRRTAAGHALLAGDPHLDLSLPSIWYEAHLVVPGQLDVYGVTIPGAPAIIIGFNRDVAWTFTNTGADVMDFWAEQVDDAERPTRYRLDGAWRPIEQRIERYLGKRGETLATDTVRYTHRGPMRRVRGRWLSMRWTVLEAGDELTGFREGARARTAAEFEGAMSARFRAPAQNMLAADRGGHIAIRSTGSFPLRAGDGSGAVVRDGSTTASDWRGALPVARYPQAQDPAQGYLVSANQQPAAPQAFGAWFGGSYDPWRALRLNAILRADSVVTPDAMRRYQTDATSARAALFLPYLVRAGQRVTPRDSADPTMRGAAEAARFLAEWDGRYTHDDRHAVLFEQTMRELADRTWDELLPSPAGRRAATPGSAVLARLLSDSASAWWDDRRTAERETEGVIVRRSLAAALSDVTRRHGAVGSAGWRWGDVQHTNVRHLLQLPGLSALDLPAQGGPSTVSPTFGGGTHGASWRMVVELGDSVRAWVTYPGGQSGNPISDRYQDRLRHWVAGALEPAIVPRTAASLADSLRAARLTLSPR